MQGFAQRKVPGGKLVKASIAFEDKIVAARFFGDFFLHPEEALDVVEQTLLGVPINASSEQLEKKIAAALKHKKAELIGAAPSDLAAVVQEAIRNAWNK